MPALYNTLSLHRQAEPEPTQQASMAHGCTTFLVSRMLCAGIFFVMEQGPRRAVSLNTRSMGTMPLELPLVPRM